LGDSTSLECGNSGFAAEVSQEVSLRAPFDAHGLHSICRRTAFTEGLAEDIAVIPHAAFPEGEVRRTDSLS